MSESETGIVCCEYIGKYKIRTRDRGSNERDGNHVGVMFARKGKFIKVRVGRGYY